MNPLLPVESVIYRRRLVRDLNAFPGIFYARRVAESTNRSHYTRCVAARLVDGRIQCRDLLGEDWFAPVRDRFITQDGDEIVASREWRAA